MAAGLAGAEFVIASPPDYSLPAAVIDTAREWARRTGGAVETVVSPEDAVRGADVVYTDVWTSMGQEAERRQRLEAFQGYQVDAALMSLAKPDAIFMHDLPAHRGEEITEDVIEGPQSVVFRAGREPPSRAESPPGRHHGRGDCRAGMRQFVNDTWDTLQRLDAAAALDIFIIAAIIFALLMVLRGTTAMTLLRGGGVIILALFLLGRILELSVVNFLVRNALPVLALGSHRHLPARDQAHAGTSRPHQHAPLAAQHKRGRSRWTRCPPPSSRWRDNRHGAIIVIERGTGLEEFIETGVHLDAEAQRPAPRKHLLPELGPARQSRDHSRPAHRGGGLHPAPVDGHGDRHAWGLGTAPRSASAS